MGEIRILGILGSQRQGSNNRFALHVPRELLPHGAALELIDLNGIPFFDRRLALSPPPAVVEFRCRVLDSDAILFATPECNHSVPGKLKSAIDWASSAAGENAWLGKPTAVMSPADGSLTKARTQHHLKKVLATLKTRTVNHPEMIDGNAGRYFSGEGKLTHEPARGFIRELIAALIGLVRIDHAAAEIFIKQAA